MHVTRQFYHCFGCGVSGDVFKFVQEIDKVSFPEAVRDRRAEVRDCAAEARVLLAGRGGGEPAARRLLDLYEQATLFFEEQLKSAEGARAREYLTGRGAEAETIAKFRIGYAPEGFGSLRDRLNGAAPRGGAAGLAGSSGERAGGWQRRPHVRLLPQAHHLSDLE